MPAGFHWFMIGSNGVFVNTVMYRLFYKSAVYFYQHLAVSVLSFLI